MKEFTRSLSFACVLVIFLKADHAFCGQGSGSLTGKTSNEKRIQEKLETHIPQVLSAYRPDVTDLADKFIAFLTKEDRTVLDSMIPDSAAEDDRRKIQGDVIRYVDHQVFEKFKELIDDKIKQCKKNQLYAAENMWLNARKCINQTPYCSESIQADILFRKQMGPSHSYVAGLWIEEMLYRLLSDERYIVDQYRENMTTDSEFLEQLYGAWERAKSGEQKTEANDENTHVFAKNNVNTWKFVQNIYANFIEKFKESLTTSRVHLEKQNWDHLIYEVLKPEEVIHCLTNGAGVQENIDEEIVNILKEKIQANGATLTHETKAFVEIIDPMNQTDKVDINKAVEYLSTMIKSGHKVKSTRSPHRLSSFKDVELLKTDQVEKRQEEKLPVLITGTSVFDSLAHCLACLYFDSKVFRTAVKEKVMESPNATFLRFVAVFTEKGATVQAYRMRADILASHYHYTEHNDMKEVDCTDDSLRKFLQQFVYLSAPSMTSFSKCKCNHSPITFYDLPVDADYFQSHGIEKLETAIRQGLSSRLNELRCERCKAGCEMSYEIHDVFFIHLGDYKTIPRSTIPVKMSLNNQVYELKSSMDYQIEKEHFVASCRRMIGTNALYDGLQHKVGIASAECVPVLLIYERIAKP